MINPKTGTTWAPDIRPEEIEEFDEEASDGAIAQYKAVDNHPILNKVLDTMAFFRTHAGAVWYNLLDRKTLLAKLNEMDAEIARLNVLHLIDSSASFAPWAVIKAQWESIPIGPIIGQIKSGYTYSLEGLKTDDNLGSFIIHSYDGSIYHARRYNTNWYYSDITRGSTTKF